MGWRGRWSKGGGAKVGSGMRDGGDETGGGRLRYGESKIEVEHRMEVEEEQDGAGGGTGWKQLIKMDCRWITG